MKGDIVVVGVVAVHAAIGSGGGFCQQVLEWIRHLPTVRNQRNDPGYSNRQDATTTGGCGATQCGVLE